MKILWMEKRPITILTEEQLVGKYFNVREMKTAL